MNLGLLVNGSGAVVAVGVHPCTDNVWWGGERSFWGGKFGSFVRVFLERDYVIAALMHRSIDRPPEVGWPPTCAPGPRTGQAALNTLAP